MSVAPKGKITHLAEKYEAVTAGTEQDNQLPSFRGHGSVFHGIINTGYHPFMTLALLLS